MRRTLRRMALRHFGADTLANGPLSSLLADVDAMLDEADADRRMVERSLDLVSQELLDRNQKLHEALIGGEVGTWSMVAGGDTMVVQGFPHPVLRQIHGRAEVTLCAFLTPIAAGDRASVVTALAADLDGGPIGIRFWVETTAGARWIEMRGRHTAHIGANLVGLCFDVTQEAEEAERQRTIVRHHDELRRLGRAVSENWGELAAYPAITEQVASNLEVDRVGIWLVETAGDTLVCVDRFDCNTGAHDSGRRLTFADAPTFVGALRDQRVVAVEDIADHPAACELATWLAPNVRSIMCASIVARGDLRGMVAFGHYGASPRRWRPEDQVFAGGVADVIALAIEGERRRRAEAALDEQHRFLRTIIDLNPSLIFAKDREGRFTLVNQAVADCYGTTVEALVGKTDADFNADADQVQGFRRDDLEVVDQRRERFIAEERITDSRGQVRYLQTVKRPIIGAGGEARFLLGVSTDITERKLAEENRLRLEEQLRQAQRLESLGLLAGGVAHDFNNLLTPILAYAEMSMAGEITAAELAENLREILEAAGRARDLTAQLLAFGRKQTLMVRALDLNDELIATRRMLARLLPENIEIRLRLTPALPPVRVDASQINQVLMNLSLNARDAMPGGGRLTFATYLEPGFPHATVVLQVGDTGEGMSEDVRVQVFEPFFTTKELGHGTGLGLATAYGIIQQHAGTIEVASVRGEGSTFTVRLPAAIEETSAPASAPLAAPCVPVVRATVLVVEDEPMVRRLVCDVLAQRGLEVLSAGRPDHAIDLALGFAGTIDLLLTDVVMPGMNGQELYRRLRETRHDLRVMFMSGYASDVLGANGLVDDELRLLLKPFAASSLLAAVDETLRAISR